MVEIGREIGHQLRAPGLAEAVGGLRRGEPEEVVAVDHAEARGLETLAQIGIGNDREGGLQPGNVEGLAGRHQRDRPRRDLGAERCDGNVSRTLMDEVAMDLVGQDQEVAAFAFARDEAELRAGEDPAGRIVRIAQDEGAGAGKRRPEAFGIDVETRCGRHHRQVDALEVPVFRRVEQGAVERRLHGNAVAGRQEGLQRHVHAGLDAGQEDQGRWLYGPAVPVAQRVHDGFAQAVRRVGITQHGLVEPPADGVEDRLGGGKVHVGDPHGQHAVRVVVPLLAVCGGPAVEHGVEGGGHVVWVASRKALPSSRTGVRGRQGQNFPFLRDVLADPFGRGRRHLP